METTQETPAQSMRVAREQRQAIISALYQQRRLHPGQPGITLTDLELMLKVSKAELEFSLWYLTEGLFVKRTGIAADGEFIVRAGRTHGPIENIKLKVTTKSKIDIRLPAVKYNNATSRSLQQGFRPPSFCKYFR